MLLVLVLYVLLRYRDDKICYINKVDLDDR